MSPALAYMLPLFPLVGVLLNGSAGVRFNSKTVSLVACAAVGLPLLAALALLVSMAGLPGDERVLTVTLYTWISQAGFTVSFGFLVDTLSMTMILVVLFVGFFIHLYSIGYMEGDPGYRRFFVYLNLFIFFMLLLVMADNLILTFLGWEGVGLCSYLLIGFWFEKKSAADAGRKAFVVNRIGDMGFMLGILMTVLLFQTVNYQELHRALEGSHGMAVTLPAVTALLFFIGAMGKSAQFPLHVWLPDAMEGPTPVSALIHAATMVNAGVYFMCRMFPLLAQAGIALPVIAAVGAFTAIYAALSAVGQTDIKKVLAYSTVSQIGYMFMAVGSGMYMAGMFHLVTHGIFKGLLFLGAGAVIHALRGEQETAAMGGLLKRLSLTSATFLLGLLALAGIFPMSGFFSKEVIIWGGFERYGLFYWFLGFGGAVITALYCGKLFGLAFLGEGTYDGSIHKPGYSMTVPLAVLGFCAATFGVFNLPMLAGKTIFGNFMASTLPPAQTGDPAVSHALETAMLLIVSIVVVVVLLAAMRLYSRRRNYMVQLEENNAGLMNLLFSGFRMDHLHDALLVGPFKRLAAFSSTVLDTIIIDGLVNRAGAAALAAGRLFALLQRGTVTAYALFIAAGIVLFLGITLAVTS
ncbi:MAG: NADH-quinone oxidoreductase subunit L [Syntrophales bacterium]|jgi:NADH-quinone oxidoreductase subunit L|nr:NADH-quinone oxidoreductase subunit L [Syntrophales bacterium]MCK9527237.1 NADH-quinone oxidoreductase subunit L [Syntrophales bacterium]MDX9921293.1 NADH-quinone oxidoreductase subunit L [Syntrophales bacterium]